MLKIIRKALHMQKNLGTRTAAGFLRNQEVTLASAVVILATPIFRNRLGASAPSTAG